MLESSSISFFLQRSYREEKPFSCTLLVSYQQGVINIRTPPTNAEVIITHFAGLIVTFDCLPPSLSISLPACCAAVTTWCKGPRKDFWGARVFRGQVNDNSRRVYARVSTPITRHAQPRIVRRYHELWTHGKCLGSIFFNDNNPKRFKCNVYDVWFTVWAF